MAKDWIVRRNAENDPNYCPYCCRCKGLVRMKKVAPFYWRCNCGAEHDERDGLQPSFEVRDHDDCY